MFQWTHSHLVSLVISRALLIKLGSDALPPDQRSPRYRFPGNNFFASNRLLKSGDNELNLQSGMGITANIKLRSRPVISLVSDLLLGKWME